MHSRSHFITAVCLASCLVLACRVRAQDEPLPASVNDPFATVKDAGLHAALSTLAGIRPDVPARSTDHKPRQVSEIYSQPENIKAIGVVLAAAESAKLNEMELPVRQYVIGAVKAAVISGATAHIPALKRLAHSTDKSLRDAVASPDALALSPSPSIEVLKECLLSAEERLPVSLANPEASQPSIDEFASRVSTLTTFASDEQRAEIGPVVERFLARYDNPKFKEYYGPRLQKMLQGGATKLHWLNANKGQSSPQGSEAQAAPKAHEPKTATPSKEPASSTPWSVIVVLIVAATGLLWLLVKNRK